MSWISVISVAFLLCSRNSLAHSVSSQLELSKACYTEYGTTIEQLAEIGSVQACAAVCAERHTCASFVYIQALAECNLNTNSVPESLDNDCDIKVTYGQPTQNHWRLSTLGDCSSDDDCQSVQNTECVSGQCLCMNGYSMDSVTSTCVTECSNYGNTFQTFENVVIPSDNDANFHDVPSIQLCWDLCLANQCRTGEFLPDQNRCRLSMSTMISASVSYQAGTILFHRNCA